jgi:hypothetical protein
LYINFDELLIKRGDKKLKKILYGLVFLTVVHFIFWDKVVSYAEDTTQKNDQVPFMKDGTKNCPIPGFAKVSKNIYRGGRPNEEGFKFLKKIRVKTVINLENYLTASSSLRKKEEKKGESLGIKVQTKPLSLIHLDKKGFSRIYETIDQLKNTKEKVYIHCWLGKERTGLVTAFHRIFNEGWSIEDAKEEMLNYGFCKWRAPLIFYIQRPLNKIQLIDS